MNETNAFELLLVEDILEATRVTETRANHHWRLFRDRACDHRLGFSRGPLADMNALKTIHLKSSSLGLMLGEFVFGWRWGIVCL